MTDTADGGRATAYYVCASSPEPASGKPDHSDASRQDGDVWTTLLRIDDLWDVRDSRLHTAILLDYLGRDPRPAEVAALVERAGWLRWTPDEIDGILGPTRQETLWDSAPSA